MRSLKSIRKVFSTTVGGGISSKNSGGGPSRFLLGLQLFGLYCGTALLFKASRMIHLGNSFDGIIQEKVRLTVHNEQVAKKEAAEFVRKVHEEQEALDKRMEDRPM
jgi:hypothetical protein